MANFGLDPASARLVLATSVLAAVIALGLWVISAWRKHLDERGPSDVDLLEQFREAYDSGEMDEEEFRRVQGILTGAPVPPRTPVPEDVGEVSRQARNTNVEGPSP